MPGNIPASQRTKWQLFFKKKAQAAAVVVLVLLSIVALLGYLIIPDKSPYANRLNVEVGAQSPMFRQLFLKIPQPHIVEQEWWRTLWSGGEDTYVYIPVKDIHLSGDTLIAEHRVDDGIYDTLFFSRSLFHIADWQIDHARDVLTEEQTFLLGSDRYGRDVWSRLVIGSRVSLAVGGVSMLLSVSIGLFMGALAGWYGRWVDKSIMYVVNVLWAIPTVLLVFAITISIGRGFWEIFIAIGLSSWVGPARLVRGQVMQEKEKDYITAAKTLGFGSLRIIFRHILPNIIGPLMVIAAANFATAILVESGLSFLGIGVQPPVPSWGLMIKEHYSYLLADKPLLAIIPGAAILLVVLSVNIIGNGLRDVYDVREKR